MRFSIGTIPVNVRPSFLVVSVLLGAGGTGGASGVASWVGAVFVSVLFHELGHAFAFIRFGHSPSIELHQMGGLTRGTPGVPTSPGRHIIISLAGPTAGFLLGGLTWIVSRNLELPPLGAQIARDLLWVNIGWGLYNLLPIWPLDGGQAFVSFTKLVWPRRGELVGLGVSCAVTSAVVIAALAFHLNWEAFIAIWFGSAGFNRLRALWSRGGDGQFDQTLAAGYQALMASQLDRAHELAEQLLATTQNPQARRDASALLSRTHLARGNAAAALAVLDEPTADPVLLGSVLARIPDRQQEGIDLLRQRFNLTGDPGSGHALVTALLLAKEVDHARLVLDTPAGRSLPELTYVLVEGALFNAGRFADAAELAGRRFETTRAAGAAYHAACCEIRMGHADESVRWLARARDAGWQNLEGITKDDDFAALRGRPDFEAILAPR